MPLPAPLPPSLPPRSYSLLALGLWIGGVATLSIGLNEFVNKSASALAASLTGADGVLEAIEVRRRRWCSLPGSPAGAAARGGQQSCSACSCPARYAAGGTKLQLVSLLAPACHLPSPTVPMPHVQWLVIGGLIVIGALQPPDGNLPALACLLLRLDSKPCKSHPPALARRRRLSGALWALVACPAGVCDAWCLYMVGMST